MPSLAAWTVYRVGALGELPIFSITGFWYLSYDLSEYLIGNEIINHHVGKRLSNPVALRAVIGKLHKAIGIEKERSIHKSEMLFKTGVVRSPWTGC